jgi:two-component system, cell cycle response regulator DivK
MKKTECKGLRVLIAEDDTDSRWILAALMKRSGYDCEVAKDGAEALRLAESFHPQIILMDLMMPNLDGWTATEQLKSNGRTCHIPILAVSADVTPSGEAAAREAGCDGFVSKPVVFRDLLDRIQQQVVG